jgi:hypothetical protein
MLKSFLLTVIFFWFFSHANSQSTQVNGQQTTQNYNFCKVNFYVIGKKKFTEIDYGNRGVNSKIIDNVPVDTLLDKVNLLKNDILILDYMNNLGWECFNIISTTTEHQFGETVIYYFRKPKTE